MVTKFVGWLAFLVISGLGLFIAWGNIPLWGWIMLTVFLSVNIGNCLGRLSIRIYDDCKPRWLHRALWPSATVSCIDAFSDSTYLTLMSLGGWLLKVVWNMSILSIMSVAYTIYYVIKFIGFVVKIVSFPSKRICRCHKE